MTRKHSQTAWFFLLAVLGLCDIAQANSISPYVYFWPGVISITVIYAFPASVLAALLERPFLTIAGIKNRTLVWSLRANFYSTLVGLLLIPLGSQALYTIGVLWCVIAFGVSCLTEVTYLRLRAHQQFAWRWVVGGNAVSSLVLMVVPPFVLWIKQHNQHLVELVGQHQTWFGGLACVLSVLVFGLAEPCENAKETRGTGCRRAVCGSTRTAKFGWRFRDHPSHAARGLMSVLTTAGRPR